MLSHVNDGPLIVHALAVANARQDDVVHKLVIPGLEMQ